MERGRKGEELTKKGGKKRWWWWRGGELLLESNIAMTELVDMTEDV